MVQNQADNKFYVRKDLAVFNPEIYSYLMAHPIKNMPRIYHLAEEANRLIVIEEYIAGSTLEELMARQGPFPDETIADWVRQLCDILQDLHNSELSIVHRDIKPTNIILSPDGIIKLLDMDAAKVCDDTKTRDTVLMGTAGFAAPEQYGFSSSTVQTDIFAIGVLMNVLSTGAIPQEKACESRLAPIIRKCTQLNPKERYSSVRQLSAVLEKFAGQRSAASSYSAKPIVSGWRRFLPPGFRGSNPLVIVCSIVGYIMLISLSFSTTVNGASSGYGVTLTRIMMCLTFLSIVLFSGNYLNVQGRFFLCRSPNFAVRILGILLADVFLFVSGIFILVMLVN